MNVLVRLISMFCIPLVLIAQAEDKGIHVNKSEIIPIIDGVILEDEWKEAHEITLRASADDEVFVFVKHDSEYLYVGFKNLMDPKKVRRNAEVLIHTGSVDLVWNEQCYWFHSSYGNCEARGSYYIWESCSNNPFGWNASTFPFSEEHDVIEFRIAFSKLNIADIKGKQLKVSFKISDPLEQNSYWPNTAHIASPSSWGQIIFD